MLTPNLLEQRLPSRYELPDSIDIPVDNELQDLVPHLLLDVLTKHWSTRADWFFGVDMGIYHTTGRNLRVPLIPDAFLSLGVARRPYQHGRPSYILWEENYIVPKLALECVSHTYGQEYDDKMKKYARLGVLYYVVYNPTYSDRDQHAPLEVYRFDGHKYRRRIREPVWMPEIGLGIGRDFGTYQGWQREWLYWYDRQGIRLLTSDERTHQALQLQWLAGLRAEQEHHRAEQERHRAEQAERRAEQLAKLLRDQGIDPDMFK